jgi:hypothetical protein
MKTKAILTIVISLITGFIFGYLTSGQVIKHEMKKRHSHSYNEMFLFRTFEIIGANEAQKDTLMPIIVVYAEKSLSLKNKVSTQFDSLMHKMNMDLRPYINDVQYNKLEENVQRLSQRHER